MTVSFFCQSCNSLDQVYKLLLVFIFSDRIGEAETMFTYGVLPTRRKRTAGGNLTFLWITLHVVLKRRNDMFDFVNLR